MKKIDYPEWVKPFDKKGHTIRIVKGAYWLFQVSSRRVPGKKYPVTSQTFIGIIDREKGLIPKKVSIQDTVFIEHGLSHFLYTNHSRDLVRSIYGYSGDFAQAIVKTAIVFFVFGGIDYRYLSMSNLTAGMSKDMVTKVQAIKEKRMSNLIRKAEEIFRKDFGDDADYMMNRLRMIQAHGPSGNPNKIDPDTLGMITERGFRYVS